MTTPWGGRAEYVPATSSTMDDAQALEDSGAPDGSLVRAGWQSSGRGRRPDRAWVSDPGHNLLFTIFWAPERFAVPTFAPSLTVGLGVCLWLESLGLDSGFPVGLKWPNDLYLGDRKAGGILVRRRWTASGPGAVHAGIGINLKSPPSGPEYRTAPTSLAEAGVVLGPEEALAGLLHHLAGALAHPDPRSACEARLWHRNQEVDLTLPDGACRRGTVRGLDDAGALVWGRSGVREVLTAGE